MEKPAGGGSYIRQNDGTLKRAEPDPVPAQPDAPKPARPPRSTTAKDK